MQQGVASQSVYLVESRGSAGVQIEMSVEVAGGWFSVRDNNRSSADKAGTALIPPITCTSINIDSKFMCALESKADASLGTR